MADDPPFESEDFHPFGDLIGLKITEVEKGYSRCELDVRDRLRNPHGVLHGGVMYSMADTGMGIALYTQMVEEEICSTIEIKMSYINPVESGSVVCETDLIERGGSIAHLESVLRNEGEVARATGTYFITDR